PPIMGSIGVPPVVSSSAQMGSTPPVDSEQHHGVLKSPVTPDLGKRRRILPYWEMGDSTYILTFRVNSGLLSENERSLVLAACRYWDSKRITLHAVVVMPDHVHMLCTPLEKTKDEWWSIADLMHSIKGFTAKEINRLRGAQGSLWQREYYDRIIRSDDDYQEKWNYVVRNPQRSGLGEEYPWVWIEENDETSTSSPLVGGVSASRRSMDQSVSHRRDADAPRGGGPDDIIDAAARNLCAIAEETRSDPRYAAANNRKTPKRIDSRLETFDCITCDKCIPVCPNAANFVYSTEPESLDFHDYGVDGDALKPGPAHTIRVDRAEQIANFADFCNDCGNCDTFCPEYDGPFIKKPNFFGSHAAWSAFKTRDGFFIDTAGGGRRILGRIKGKTYRLETEQGWNGMRFEDGTVCLFLRADDHTVLRWFAFGPANTTGHVIDMTAYHTMRILLKSLLRTDHIHQVNATQS
ncbi:MAG: transposase, partial [Phycisphaerae bacterium]